MPELPNQVNRSLMLVGARVIRDTKEEALNMFTIQIAFDEPISGKRLLCELPVEKITNMP